MRFGRQCWRVRLGRDGQAVGQRDGPARVVPHEDAVRGRGFVLPANGFVRAAGEGGGQRGGRGQRVRRGVVGGRELGAGRLGHAAAAQGGDAAAVAAGQDGGAGHQAGRLALGGGGRERWHGGLLW